MIRHYKNWQDIILNHLRMKGEFILELRNGFKFSVRSRMDTHVIEDMFFSKYHFLPESFLSKKKPILIDMGAHIGAYSIWAHSKNTTSTIISLEPDPRNFKLLGKNIKHNKIKNIFPICACGSDKIGTVDFFISEDKRNIQSSSLVRRSKFKIKSYCFNIKEIIKKFDIKKIDVLKLDVEGSEFEILLGLDKEIFNIIDFIDVEYHLDTGHHSEKVLEETLIKNGYRISNKRYSSKYYGIIVARKEI